MSKTKEASAAPNRARVLADLPHLGACNGDVIVSTPEHIAALASAHQVDSHPAAVEYAISINARTVDIAALRAAQLADAAAGASSDQAPA